ncbi:dihydrofolate reductase family protein [Pseudoxanthomonas sp. PXM01]|uniref:dihydrofolate reductase family protein n=1 Tax=Pseudoxanthomonas sp. PXM01 TaxID=2769295 RepID=UPI00177D7759|nr:dihydrofolate reductase family protein [Pseudoxanthomonas sp. PXM01]MBD9467984.1 dihydrofolate reductase family protein [Pseudoxanthomonas sp. PXM01]
MSRLIAAVMVSLDGVMQAPGGPDEDTSGGFAHGGWVWPYAGEDEAMDGLFAQPFALLLGRRTYDIFAGYWPQVPSDAPHGGIADAFNGATKYVATHHPDTLAWRHSHALGADVVSAVRALKHRDGPDLVTQGSSDVLHQLLASDVVDELRLLTYPVLLGRGKRLFDDRTQAASFRLAASRTTKTGVIVSRYLRDGDVRTGSFVDD